MDIKKSEAFFFKMHKELSCDLKYVWGKQLMLRLNTCSHSLFSFAYPHHINFTPIMEMLPRHWLNLFSVWYIKSGGNCIWKSQLIKHFIQPWTDLLLRIKGTVYYKSLDFCIHTEGFRNSKGFWVIWLIVWLDNLACVRCCTWSEHRGNIWTSVSAKRSSRFGNTFFPV